MNRIWDSRKAKSNLGKHGVRFSDAEVVFFDSSAITEEDTFTRGEQRFASIDLDAIGRVIVVASTYREDDIRLISARKATRKERLQYEEGIWLQ